MVARIRKLWSYKISKAIARNFAMRTSAMVNYEQRKLSPSLNKAEQFVKLKRGNSLVKI